MIWILNHDKTKLINLELVSKLEIYPNINSKGNIDAYDIYAFLPGGCTLLERCPSEAIAKAHLRIHLANFQMAYADKEV